LSGVLDFLDLDFLSSHSMRENSLLRSGMLIDSVTLT
jgi:hypothetical protein